MVRTAQGKRIEINKYSKRRVLEHAKKEFVDLRLETQVMLITQAQSLTRLSGKHPGMQLNFSVINQQGKEYFSNIFIGDRDSLASHHAKLLGCSTKDLKDRTILETRLNKLVGRCLRYCVVGKWIRPIQNSPVVRLDRFLESHK